MSAPRSPPISAAAADAHVGKSPSTNAVGKRINVGHTERKASVGIGAGLVGLGLLRGRLSGLALAGLGVLVAKRGLEGHCAAYEKLGVNTAASDRTDPQAFYDHGVKIEEAVTVNKPARELYDYWRDLTHMPEFMPHVERVDVEEGNRSHWVMKGPAGTTLEYDSETINDEPGKLIAWRSVGGSDIQNAGSVRFVAAPGDRGTEVRLNIEYLPPAGFLGAFGPSCSASSARPRRTTCGRACETSSNSWRPARSRATSRRKEREARVGQARRAPMQLFATTVREHAPERAPGARSQVSVSSPLEARRASQCNEMQRFQ